MASAGWSDSEYRSPSETKRSAEADLSYELQRAITRQQVRGEELKVEIVERQKAIELMQAEVERRKRELEAEIVEPALAKARRASLVFPRLRRTWVKPKQAFSHRSGSSAGRTAFNIF